MHTDGIGHAAPGFEPVRNALLAYAGQDPTFSAQVAVYQGGDLVVDLTVGGALVPDSLLPVFSCTKGAAALVVAVLVDEGLLDLDARVASLWPAFAANGKDEVTVRQLLSHQAGLPGVDGGFTYADLFDHDALASKLAGQLPFWRPGAAHSYHALTIGVLADELVRRVSGETLSRLFTTWVTEARGVDFHLGSPADLDGRFTPIDLPTETELAGFPLTSSSYRRAALATDPTPLYVRANDVDFRRAEVPAAGGIASARGIAGMYAAVANALAGQPRLVGEQTLSRVTQLQVAGPDLGSDMHSRFGVIWQKPTTRHDWGGHRAFGHDGAGGGLGYHDPDVNISFGYVVKRIPLPGGVDLRALALSRLTRECAGQQSPA